MSSKYNNRFRRQLVQQVKCLSETEHEEVYKIMFMNNVEYTRNKNGLFFNLSLVDDDVIKQIHDFVVFSLENKKHLDEYDKRMNECKINNNYSDILPAKSSGEDNSIASDDVVKLQEWSKLVDPYKDKLTKVFDELHDNIVKASKRKCSTKFNLAKKKYAKRTTADKKFDYEQESLLIEEEYIILERVVKA
jgi:hypothetical protein